MKDGKREKCNEEEKVYAKHRRLLGSRTGRHASRSNVHVKIQLKTRGARLESGEAAGEVLDGHQDAGGRVEIPEVVREGHGVVGYGPCRVPAYEEERRVGVLWDSWCSHDGLGSKMIVGGLGRERGAAGEHGLEFGKERMRREEEWVRLGTLS